MIDIEKLDEDKSDSYNTRTLVEKLNELIEAYNDHLLSEHAFNEED